MHAGLTRSVAALVAAGSLLAIAGCADPDDTTDAATTVATLTTANVQTIPPTAPPTTAGPGAVSQIALDYEIKAGDYLSGIAARYKVKLDDLIAFNDWADGTNHPINPGEIIKIPPGYTVPDESATTTTAATETTDGDTGEGGDSTTSPPTTVDTAGGGTYTVVANDYLQGIAEKVGSTVDAIVEANGWPEGAAHVLQPGEKIKIP
jgi:LysM repeat protein